MFWARMGSLNALEMSGQARFWKRWLGGRLPSADTMGTVHSKMDASTLRDAMHQVYGQLKRNKALPDNRGISLAIVDGHESHTSYLQHCSGCLARTIDFKTGRPASVLSPAGDAAAGAWRASQPRTVADPVGSRTPKHQCPWRTAKKRWGYPLRHDRCRLYRMVGKVSHLEGLRAHAAG